MQASDRLRLAFVGDPNSVHTRRWLAFFVARGHEVHLLDGFGTRVRDGLPAGIELHRYSAFGRGIRFLSLLQTRRELGRLLRRLRPDVLHAHSLSRYGWQARLSGFHPFVISPWGSDLYVTPLRSRRARLWARITLRAADLVTVVSEQMRATVMAAGAHPERIRTVQFGVDTNRFRPGPGAGSDEVANRLGVAGRRVIFSPRAALPLYRHETILAAVEGLGDDVRLVMTGRNADAAYLAQLRSTAERGGFGDRLIVIDDIDDETHLALHQLAAATVSVPGTDGFPVSVLEAMACGTPVVAGDIPPVRAVLGEIAPQLLVPVGDADALGAALRRALAMSPADRRSLGAALRRYAVSVADYETNMLRMEALYRELAAR
jgi:L-malate glycosyltransferase